MMNDRDQELFAKIKHQHEKLKEKQKGFKKFKIGIRDSIAFEFNKEDIASIEKRFSGNTRVTVKNGDWFECDKSVDRLKEIFEWSDENN
ncbi:hypothetical protein [Bacillus atrophaeus]|uniref:hypothetical protein n=1 Tax=Bacillus atrophaeus TaxID=1452 RepID=UPI003F59B91F